jgi:hypothetical protein
MRKSDSCVFPGVARRPYFSGLSRGFGFVLAVLALPLPGAAAREKSAIQYGAGLIVNVPVAESELTQVVQEVAQNGIIRGSKEYNKDEYITGASAVPSTRAFKEWTEGGKAFYKIRLKALDPENFKDTNDTGTLAVRYVVQGQAENHTVLHIDAVFLEDSRHVSHASNGSVEGAEYKSIHDRIESLELMKSQTADAEREKAAHNAGPPSAGTPAPQVSSSVSHPAQISPATPSSSETAQPVVAPVAQNLEQHVQELRRQVERLVKAPGAALKAAPFHSASTLKSLSTGTEVLIVISTPYWLGVETHDGQHGWILRDDLEQLP